MKANELRELPTEELEIRLEETKEELFNLRFQSATGQLENYGRIGQVRRDVARILTLLQERQLGIQIEPSREEPKRKTRRRRKSEDEVAAEATDEVEDTEEQEEE